jgi:hypothetical protein
MLSFVSGSAIKRITAGVKAAADRRCQVSIWGLAFTLPVETVSNEKRIQPFGSSLQAVSLTGRQPVIGEKSSVCRTN